MNTTFTLPDADGNLFSSGDHLPLVLYFYPKDSTSGCTKEAQEFTELLPQFQALGCTVAGVSRDSEKSHRNFICRYSLGVALLSDREETVCRQFDVIREKSMYGRKVMGVERSTFLIGRDGSVLREWRKVKAAGHAAQVLDAARELLGAA